MNMRTFLTVLIVVLGQGCVANAGDELKAKELAGYCSSKSAPEDLFCRAYIAGFGDGISAGVASTLEFTQGKVCIPTNINGLMALLIAKDFLRNHPDVLAESAKTALTIAMWRAYPCK